MASVRNEEDKAALRVVAHEALEEAAGDCSLWGVFDEVDSEFGEIELDKLATEEVTIISGVWGQSRTSGEESYVAYSLGFDSWYVVHTNTLDEVRFDSIVPESRRDEVFQDLARRWIAEVGPASCSLPTEFYSTYSRDPWFIRELSEAIGGSYNDPLDTIVNDILGGQEVTDAAREAIHMYWWSAVEVVDGYDDADVPGLAVVSTNSDVREFETWVDGVVLKWRDIRQDLDADDALCLRLTCQFMALS